MQSRTLVASSVAVALACATTAAALDRLGTGARVFREARPLAVGVEPIVARDAREVYDAWRRAGVRGRIVVHAGTHLHLSTALIGYPEDGPLARPGTGDLFAVYEERLSTLNYLWVAAWTGVARRVEVVLPEHVLRRRHREGDLSAVEDRLPVAGATAFAVAQPRRRDEPVLLVVEASWFETSDGAELMDALRRARIVADLVTVSLSEDVPEVTESARSRAREFARAIARGADQ